MGFQGLLFLLYFRFFLWLICMFLVLMIVFKNFIGVLVNLYFFLFRVRFVFCNLYRVFFRCLLCFLNNLVKKRILFIWYGDFFIFFKFCEICFWKFLGVELILNGGWLKGNWLNGVVKVLSLDDFGDKLICQNFEFVFRLLNIFVLVRRVSFWLIQGKEWNFFKMFFFSFVRFI